MKWPWVSRKDYDAILDALKTAQAERAWVNGTLAEAQNAFAAHAKEWSRMLEDGQIRENELAAALEAEKQRARRRSRRNETLTGVRGVREPVVDMRDATAATDEPKVAGPSPNVLKAIRQAAGGDRPLARHLHAYAQEALDTGTSEREVIRMIRQGEQVAL